MKGDLLFTETLLHLLTLKEVNFGSIKKHVIEAYNRENGCSFDLETATDAEEKNIVRWLNGVMMDHKFSAFEITKPLLHNLFSREVAVNIPLFSNSLSVKVTTLSHFHCPICKAENQFPVKVIPLKINPESKQALAQIKGLRAAYEKAIKSAFVKKEMSFLPGEHLCVLVVFVLGNGNKEKDLDNMSKAMMDALQGDCLFPNDADIDHLNLFKIRHKNPDSFVYINIRRSDLNEHHDVLIEKFDHVMLVPGIDEFFEEEKKRLKAARKTSKGKAIPK